MSGDLFLFRGLSGAGKSTVSDLLADVTISNDDFRIGDPGDKIANLQAIQLALAFGRDEMLHGVPRIGVANVFATEAEMAPWRELAQEFGYRIHTLIVENRHGSGSEHDVPKDAIDRWVARFSIKLRSEVQDLLAEVS